MMALGALLTSGVIDLDNALVQCMAAQQILASINPSFATELCECVLGNSSSSSCAASIPPPSHTHPRTQARPPRLALHRHHA